MKVKYSNPSDKKNRKALQLAPATEPPLPPPPQVENLSSLTFPPSADGVENSNASLRQEDNDDNSESSESERPGAFAGGSNTDQTPRDDETIWSPGASQGPQVQNLYQLATAQPVQAVLAADSDWPVAEVVRESAQEDNAEDTMPPPQTAKRRKYYVAFGLLLVVLAAVVGIGIAVGPGVGNPAIKFSNQSPEPPTQSPTTNNIPTASPGETVTQLRTQSPTINSIPTASPSKTVAQFPTQPPPISSIPTASASETVTQFPTQPPAIYSRPTASPSETATQFPTQSPTINNIPTAFPSKTATQFPTQSPTINSIPTASPSKAATQSPTRRPAISSIPTAPPSKTLTQSPTQTPPISSIPTVPPIKTLTQSPTQTSYSPRGFKQLGFDLDGEAAEDNFGYAVAMSSDGSRIIAGAPYNDGNGGNSGHARVFDWTGTDWEQVGQDLDGEAAGDRFGTSVAMSSDGSRIAVGATGYDGNAENLGSVRIFDWTGTDWVQLGPGIDGQADGDQFGTSVAMSSDGSRIVGGARFNDGNADNAGRVRIFNWTGTKWVQVGQDLDGEAVGDQFGTSVAMSSDGSRIVGGARHHDGDAFNSGRVRIFDWTGTEWLQVGQGLNGEAEGDQFGKSVAMSSDGSRIAVGALANDGNGGNSGHVRVFDWTGTEWVQIGRDLDGEAADDRFGTSVTMSSDGSRVAAGGHLNDGNGDRSGHVRIFDWTGTEWVKIGQDPNGEAAEDNFGDSVAMSSDGSRIVAGATYNDGNGVDSGHVRVFEIQ